MNNEYKGLRHYIDIVESAQQTNEEGIMNALGQLGGAVAGTGVNAVKGVGNAIGGAYDAAKQGVTNAANAVGSAVSGAVAPVVQGAQQGYAAATGGKPPAQGQSANPTKKPTAAPAAGKADPNVMALQQKLIAAGAKIKADGIMGPATRAAQAQFPNVTTQTDAEKAHAASLADAPANPTGPFTKPMAPAATNAAPAAAAPAADAPAPGMQAVGDDEGNTTITRPDGSTMVVGADGKQIMPGSNPNLPQNKGMFNTIANAATGKGDFQKPTGFIPPAQAPQFAVKESTGYDEIQRLVSLVQYK